MPSEFHDEQGSAAIQLAAAGPLPGRGQGEGVGDFQRAGKKAGFKDLLDAARGSVDGIKPDCQAGA